MLQHGSRQHLASSGTGHDQVARVQLAAITLEVLKGSLERC